jgi:hypothetical protein
MWAFQPPVPENLIRYGGYRAAMPLAKGVVMAVHYADEVPADRHRPGALTVDILTLNGDPLYRVPLTYHGLGVRSGSRWHPRPGTKTLDGQPLAWEASEGALAVDPEQVDGEWVLVGFIAGQAGAPIVLGCVDHPRSTRTHGAGPSVAPDPAADGTAGEEVKGWRRDVAHVGTICAIDEQGNVTVDATRAGTAEDGVQAAGGGLLDVNVREGQPIIIRQGGVRRFRVTVVDGVPQVDLLAGNRPLARLADAVAITSAGSPNFNAFVRSTVAALATIATWVNDQGGPLVGLPVVPEEPVPGDADAPPALALGTIATASSQIRGS